MTDERKCPLGECDGGTKILHHGKFWTCRCKKIREKELAFQGACKPVGCSPFTSTELEALDPFNKSIYFVGPEVSIWSLIHGELEKQYDNLDGKFRFHYTETYAAAGSYSHDEHSIDIDVLLNVDLLVFYLTSLTCSEKLNQIVRWVFQQRSSHGKPIWFVASDKKMEKTYSPEVIDLLKGLKNTYDPTRLKGKTPYPPEVQKFSEAPVIKVAIPTEKVPEEVSVDLPTPEPVEIPMPEPEQVTPIFKERNDYMGREKGSKVTTAPKGGKKKTTSPLDDMFGQRGSN